MTKAIRIHAPGGPEALSYDDIELTAPAEGEVQLRQTAIGLNFIDVYHRTGLYPIPDMPAVIGLEAAGVVETVGAGVTELSPGDRVAYANPPLGAYAQARNMPAHRLIKLPEQISDEQAAAIMLQGMTVEYLIRRTYQVKAGDTVLFHAAAGGVGLMACQWLKHLGATVIGTVGSEEKADLAKANGCDHTILYNKEDIAARVREITDGAGVPVVYDSVGKDTFEASIDSLSPLGLFVTFGNASGPLAPIDPGFLAQKGSLFMTRPTLMTYTAKREDMVKSAEALFDVVGSGAVKVAINQRYPLAEAADAHRDLEARKTTGSTILLP
ncbi:quinone oxidoreductase family protein [Denitrobaculum tricleocarpae]|uniref:Quinone oxidoreductase n=1 Tax=Denitrobaculum tricleocarpae TaxID=2591009 RepID=A0A545TRH5_9PROT|nr:quinone oxidoreductase [Denitrobaculum tricleocarpae]TQV79830.1 quinone oxidoreductase [Denitrobaculum tricleocarpae]